MQKSVQAGLMESAAAGIIIFCWCYVILYWLASKGRVKATAQRQSVASALAHRLPLAAGWFLMGGYIRHSPLNHLLTPATDPARVAGMVLCVAGFYFTIWARRTLAGNWSSDVTLKQGHELIRKGPYRIVRHPIYTGLLTMCLATAIAFGCVRFWLALPCWLVAFSIKIRQEERLMLEHFPAEYPVYQKEVKALVPFVL
ncbi:MAG TPA: isoprenylcysteine carboxylmethyltransferase family protein [Verrucomicrobiae bacterium]|nr:isoprenylcysteine carboxylmethyltransferase family protein [Verrucomicrobiae bacterium]